MAAIDKITNERHKQFVLEYIMHFNGTKAYKAIYPNAQGDTARSKAVQLVAKDNIKAAIEEEAKKIIGKSEVDVAFIIGRYKEIASSNIDELVTWNEDGEVKVTPSDKLKTNFVRKIKQTVTENKDGTKKNVLEFEVLDPLRALEDLSKYHNIFTDKSELDINVKGKIIYLDKQDENL